MNGTSVHPLPAASPVVSIPLGRQVANAIRHEILMGIVTPGETLQQDQLCERFGTSRMPVRDALRQLRHEGFLVARPNNHVQVVTFQRADIDDMFEATATLHGRLTRRAAERATTEDLLELRRLHTAMEDCLAAGQLAELWDRNRAFHRRIDELGSSPKLIAALRAVTIDVHRDALYLTVRQALHSNAEHARILDAMEARDGGAAEDLVAVHVMEARDDVVRHLTEVGVLRGEDVTGAAVPGSA